MNSQLHKKIGKIFEDELIRENGGPSILCDIYDKLTDGNDYAENCLGENFNQLIQCIRIDFFANYKPSAETTVAFYFGTYNYWLYLIVERFEFIFEVLNPDNKYKPLCDYKIKEYKTFKKVKDWCIFFKHPREFTFAHWPTYVFETDVKRINQAKENNETIIDYEYVKANFTKNGKKLPLLENNPNIVVILPDLVDLTKDYIDEVIKFITFICKNDFIASILRSKSTIDDYYKEFFELIDSIAIDTQDGSIEVEIQKNVENDIIISK
jgi:hypothetical protein